MRTSSLWEHTLSFFPQFLAAVHEHIPPGTCVAVVGASDGKFVLPLAAAGYRVVAIERDPLALHGGQVHLPGGITTQAAGLITRLKAEDLKDQVQVVEQDFLAAQPPCGPCDAVWTSCSWHYSVNHDRPLADFIGRMQELLRPGGLFGAEFMMPTQSRHFVTEHYISPERLSRHFAEGWTILLTVRTGEFTERAHVGQLQNHTHRMGVLIAVRDPAQTSGE
jgi:SAM-dependent methyltransferase